MAFRVVNVNRPHISDSSHTVTHVTLANPTVFSTIREMIANALGNPLGNVVSVVVPYGIYEEDVEVPDGIILTSLSTPQIKGKVTFSGNGEMYSFNVDTVEARGNQVIEKCNIRVCNVTNNAFAHLTGNQCETISVENGKIFARGCNIGGNGYAITLSNSTGVIESSTIEGSSKILHESVLDCKQTSIVGSNDLFETEDETSTLQLFNCTVFGNTVVKSGPGTSIRGNVVALSTAVDFVGGENIKVDSI